MTRGRNDIFTTGGKIIGLVALCLLVILILPYASFTNKNDAFTSKSIVVLGGGLSPDGSVPNHTKLRLAKAVELFHKFDKKATIFTLSGSSYNSLVL